MRYLKPALILPLAAALALTACANSGPRQTGGAATGAVGGAIVGGAIGQQLDIQAGDLRAGFDDSRISVVNTGNSLVVTMPDDITFDTDSARLTASIRKNLRALADHLQKYPNSSVQVVGHTDNTGSAAYNLNLSRQRAAAVSNVLINQGVAQYRITSIGRGEDQPVASNLTPEGRAQNRRVEIHIIPNG